VSAAPRTVPYAPRAQFMPFHDRTSRWSVLVCHRRAGKTVAAVNDTIARALHTYKPNARYAYVAPLFSQAKQIAWDYLLRYTADIRRYMNVSELTVELVNGARIRLYGADNPDAMRGIYLDGVVMDEPAQMKFRIWTEVILPALADRNGWGVFIGTPAGRNEFHRIYARAQGDPEWFSMLLKASESGILPQSELDRIRSQMNDEDAYQQEFECNFDAAVRGSYFGKIINAMGDRLRGDLYDSDVPVDCSFDLGIRDDSAVWFWQRAANETRYIDYDDASGLSVKEWIERLDGKGYALRYVWLPHDAKARSLQTGKSVVEQFHAHGVKVRLTPTISLQNGIQAARDMLQRCYMDTNNQRVNEGLDLLRLYQRLYDTRTQSFAEAPRHDFTSHAADAFRYSSLVAHRDVGGVTDTVKQAVRALVTPAASRTLNSLWDTAARNPYGRIQ
jgi:hypothetical protein